tara:strand:- start:22 stop:171 length:150 start_codon:yes stop_codon:yes gene_type:complete
MNNYTVVVVDSEGAKTELGPFKRSQAQVICGRFKQDGYKVQIIEVSECQ